MIMQDKYCPLIKKDCYAGQCAFYAGEQCAITAIAESLRVRAAQENELGKKLDNIAGRINGVWGELRDRH